MPVYWKLRVKDGWKAKENERVGRCMLMVACDKKTNKELFMYAPNLVDEPFFVNGFEKLKVFDELNKSLSKARLLLSNVEKEIISFEKKTNATATTINWNATCKPLPGDK